MKHEIPGKHNSRRWLAAAMLASVVITGCGGGVNYATLNNGTGTSTTTNMSPGASSVETAPINVSDSVMSVFDYILSLFAQTSETTEPVDANAVTLAADDGAEPNALP